MLGEESEITKMVGNYTEPTSKPVLRNLTYEASKRQDFTDDAWKDLDLT